MPFFLRNSNGFSILRSVFKTETSGGVSQIYLMATIVKPEDLIYFHVDFYHSNPPKIIMQPKLLSLRIRPFFVDNRSKTERLVFLKIWFDYREVLPWILKVAQVDSEGTNFIREI